jgi:hypothetical protein
MTFGSSKYSLVLTDMVGRDSSVGIATRYGLDVHYGVMAVYKLYK